MKTKTFYALAGLLLVLTFWNAAWKGLRSMGDDPNPEHYEYMAPEDRIAEFKSLQAEIVNPRVDAQEYFKTLMRFIHLEEATRRARLEESDTKFQGAYHGMILAPMADPVAVRNLENEYVNKLQGILPRNDELFQKAKEASGIAMPKSHSAPMDPQLPLSASLLYVAGLLFAFGHYHIRNKKLGGNLLLASDIRFWLWLAVWIPGVFRYPTAVDIKYQILRARRFATFILSTCLPLTAAACAGKRVKIEPDEQRKDTEHTLRLEVSTTTWPKYLGGNGAVFHSSPVQQTSMTLSLSKGFYFGAWDSVPLGGPKLEQNFGYEVDFSGGWNGQLHGFNLSTSMTHVGVTPLLQYRGDVIQFSATVSRDQKIGFNQVLTPYFWVAHVMPTIGNSPRQGNFYHEGLRWNWKRGPWSASMDAELMYDSGAFGFNSGYLLRGGTNISRTVGKHMSIGVPTSWATPLSQLGDGRRSQIQVGVTAVVH